MTDAEARALEIVARIAKKEVSALRPEQHLVADLGIDSPRALELLCDLEEELKVEVPEDAVTKIETVQDILSMARELGARPQSG